MASTLGKLHGKCFGDPAAELDRHKALWATGWKTSKKHGRFPHEVWLKLSAVSALSVRRGRTKVRACVHGGTEPTVAKRNPLFSVVRMEMPCFSSRISAASTKPVWWILAGTPNPGVTG